MRFANEQDSGAPGTEGGRAGEADDAGADDRDQRSVLHPGTLKPARDGARIVVSNIIGDTAMLRTIFAIGIMALLGLFALKFIFGVFGGLMSILFGLLSLAIKVAGIGLLVYLVIRIISPDTARNLRERWSGSGD
jgi:hypothetical protein